MDFNGRVAWSTALSNTCNFTLLIRVSASLDGFFSPCNELCQAQGKEL